MQQFCTNPVSFALIRCLFSKKQSLLKTDSGYPKVYVTFFSFLFCLQHPATHCNTLQHTATHCNTLQHTVPHCSRLQNATHCNTLRHNATHCDTLQHTATHYNTLQHTATHFNTLQHTATHCNTLQHAAHWAPLGFIRTNTNRCFESRIWKLIVGFPWFISMCLVLSAMHCKTLQKLQHTATHCNTLQHTAPHCNILQHQARYCNTRQHTSATWLLSLQFFVFRVFLNLK